MKHQLQDECFSNAHIVLHTTMICLNLHACKHILCTYNIIYYFGTLWEYVVACVYLKIHFQFNA